MRFHPKSIHDDVYSLYVLWSVLSSFSLFAFVLTLILTVTYLIKVTKLTVPVTVYLSDWNVYSNDGPNDPFSPRRRTRHHVLSRTTVKES